ncbi:MAG: hypothetical protein AB7F35_17375 [Acetobacteraceae bacterium]
MACFAPIYYLIHRTMPDGSEGLLMAADVSTAVADAAVAAASGAWTAEKITQGRDVVLEGEALREAIARVGRREAA